MPNISITFKGKEIDIKGKCSAADAITVLSQAAMSIVGEGMHKCKESDKGTAELMLDFYKTNVQKTIDDLESIMRGDDYKEIMRQWGISVDNF